MLFSLPSKYLLLWVRSVSHPDVIFSFFLFNLSHSCVRCLDPSQTAEGRFNIPNIRAYLLTLPTWWLLTNVWSCPDSFCLYCNALMLARPGPGWLGSLYYVWNWCIVFEIDVLCVFYCHLPGDYGCKLAVLLTTAYLHLWFFRSCSSMCFVPAK